MKKALCGAIIYNLIDGLLETGWSKKNKKRKKNAYAKKYQLNYKRLIIEKQNDEHTPISSLPDETYYRDTLHELDIYS